jgi:DNA-binding transcriptional ArsR family regulator
MRRLVSLRIADLLKLPETAPSFQVMKADNQLDKADKLSDSDPIRLESVLYALSDPIRLHIVSNLAARGELACFAAVAGLDIAKSTQSHHYRILREAGIIAQRKEGVCFITALRKDEIDARFPGLLDTVLRNYKERDLR